MRRLIPLAVLAVLAYAAQLIAKRLDQPTGAYFENDNAYWIRRPPDCNILSCNESAYRDWGRSAYSVERTAAPPPDPAQRSDRHVIFGGVRELGPVA